MPTYATKALLLWLAIVSLVPVGVAVVLPERVTLAVLLAGVIDVASLLVAIPPRRPATLTSWLQQLAERFVPPSTSTTKKE